MTYRFQARLFWTCLPLLGLLVGCATLPKYQAPPAVELGPGYLAPPPEPSDLEAATTAELDTWWEALGDPTLTRLVEEALEKNLDLRLAATRIAEARANLDRVDGRRFPAGTARADLSERRQSENGPLPVGRIPGLERDQTLHDLALDASWEIDMYGRFGRAMKVAGARLEATEDEALGLRLSLAAEVARTYLSLRGAQRELAAREEVIAALEKTLALARQRVAAGDLAPNELASLEARLAWAKAIEPASAVRI